MKRQIYYILFFVLSFGLLISSVQTVSAQSQSIAELEKELEELKNDRSSIDEEESDAESQIAENERRQNEVQNKINEIDGELEVTETNINSKQQEINTTNAEISQLEASITEKESDIADTEEELEMLETEIEMLSDEITELIDRIAERDALIKNRLRSMQHNGGQINYLQVLFGAQSFGDFINRITAVTKIYDSDRTIMAAQEKDKADLEDKRVSVEEKKVTVEDKKTQLIADKEALDVQKSEVESKRAVLVAQKQELSNLQAQLNEQRTVQVATQGELEEEFFELEELKMSIEDERQILADQERIVKQALAEAEQKEKERVEQLAKDKESENPSGESSPRPNRPPVGGGVLGMPVGGANNEDFKVTSQYGMRRHPIRGTYSMHYGIDFARNDRNSPAPPIYASESGVVVAASYFNGYGNTVIVNHFDTGLTTLYAHLSSIHVSPSQIVERGQQIGIMGTSGDSTGIHLHFEVFPGKYKPGTQVNPLNYLPSF